MIQEKFIDGYDDKYSVNTLGEVFSYAGVEKLKLRQSLGNHGYSVVGLSRKKIKVFLVHRIVASAFIPNPENKRCVNHKNGVRTDNKVENLEWVTYQENHIHSFKELGRKGGRIGKKNYMPCLGKFGKDHHGSITVIQLSMSGELICEFNGVAEAARNTGANRTSITSVCKGRRNHAGGFKWEYKNKIN